MEVNMLKRISTLLILFFATVGLAGADIWTYDKSHSSIGFSVRHLVISNVKGFFHDYDGHVKFDGQNLEDGSAEVIIQVASIDTDNERRDTHLKSEDFFHVEKFPVIKFQSKKITRGKNNDFTMVGDLTIKDVAREVTLNCELHGVVTDHRGNTRAGFSAETTINRQDFNVKWDNKLQDGSLVVSNEVTITLELELIKQE